MGGGGDQFRLVIQSRRGRSSHSRLQLCFAVCGWLFGRSAYLHLDESIPWLRSNRECRSGDDDDQMNLQQPTGRKP